MDFSIHIYFFKFNWTVYKSEIAIPYLTNVVINTRHHVVPSLYEKRPLPYREKTEDWYCLTMNVFQNLANHTSPHG